jgi:hypothetical protein
MDLEDNVAIEGDDQTSAPVTAPAEEAAAPATARDAVRLAFEQAKVKASDQEEERADRAARSASKGEAPGANEGEDTGKPTLDRTRDPRGKFVKAGATETPSIENAALEAAEAHETPKEEVPSAVAGPLKPPPGWSAAARIQFEKLPPEVREAVAKRESEVAAGFQAKEAVIQKYKGLETYTPMIEGSGLSHAEFTKRAVEWEQSLKTNPVGTLLHVAKLGNVDIIRLAQQIVQSRGGPQAQGQPQQQAAPQPQQPQPDIASIVEAKLAERERAVAERQAHGTVDQFLADPKNIHAEAVAEDMAFYISTKRADTLEQAYEMACYAHPEIRALLIRQAGANPGAVSETERARRRASEAKAAAKTTIGAPSGLPPNVKKDAHPATIRDAVRMAYEKAREQA